MRIFIVCSLLFLASCTTPSNTPITNTTPTKTVATENRTVATPTYGTGKTQIEIFADFQCPACIAANDSIQPIFEQYAASGKVTITFRQFPLTMHNNAKGDAIAALCSAEQGKYMEYKKGLYLLEKTKALGKTKAEKTVTDADRTTLAKEKGLDEAKFSACLASRAYEKQVDADIALGDSKGVNATPTIYLDGIKLDMALFRDIDGFKTFLESRMK